MQLCFVVFFRPADAAPYDIKTSFPNRVYDDPTATLQECGLVPNATLHLLAKKVWHYINETRSDSLDQIEPRLQIKASYRIIYVNGIKISNTRKYHQLLGMAIRKQQKINFRLLSLAVCTLNLKLRKCICCKGERFFPSFCTLFFSTFCFSYICFSYL